MLALLVLKKLSVVVAHCVPVKEAASVGVGVGVARGDSLSLGKEVVLGELLRLSASPRDGERKADADSRVVTLRAELGVGALESEREAVSDGKSLKVGVDEVEP